MTPKILIAGKLASGKTSLASELRLRLGWPTTSFGRILFSYAKANSLPTNREALQSLGQRLITTLGPAGLVDWVIDHSPDTVWGEALILDGVRHVGVYSRLRDLFPQHVLVYCSVDPQVQIQRIMARDGLDLEAATRIAGHPTEMEVHELHSLAAATWNASTAAVDIERVLSAVAGLRDAP